MANTQMERAAEGAQGVVISKAAMQGIKLMAQGIKASQNKAAAEAAAVNGMQILSQGLCLAVQNGCTARLALETVSSIKGVDISAMHKTEKSNLQTVAEGIDGDIMVRKGDGTIRTRDAMVGKEKVDKLTKVKTVEWPSLQTLAAKVREGKAALALEKAEGAEKKRLEDKAKADKADKDMKSCRAVVKHFKAVGPTVRNIALAVLADENTAKVDAEKAKVLQKVADLGPTGIRALAESLKIKL